MIRKTLIAAATLATLATGAFAQDKGSVGIAMPTQSSLRWISDGNELKSALEGMGFQLLRDVLPERIR